MIVKKLRNQKGWSQEQLATFCGLSLRTIQRVEAGNKASLDTLKSLASVFEVELSKLTEEIIVIEKESDDWKAEPVWIKLGMIGIKKRSHMLLFEYFFLSVGFITMWLNPTELDSTFAFFGAYTTSKLVTYIDQKGYW